MRTESARRGAVDGRRRQRRGGLYISRAHSVGRGEGGRDSCAVPPRKSRPKQMYIKQKGMKNMGGGKWDGYIGHIQRQIAPKWNQRAVDWHLRLAKSLVTLALTACPRCAQCPQDIENTKSTRRLRWMSRPNLAVLGTSFEGLTGSAVVRPASARR